VLQIFSDSKKAWTKRSSWKANVTSCCLAGSAVRAGISSRTSSSCLSWTLSSTCLSRCASSSILPSWRWSKMAWITTWKLPSDTATTWVVKLALRQGRREKIGSLNFALSQNYRKFFVDNFSSKNATFCAYKNCSFGDIAACTKQRRPKWTDTELR